MRESPQPEPISSADYLIRSALRSGEGQFMRLRRSRYRKSGLAGAVLVLALGVAAVATTGQTASAGGLSAEANSAESDCPDKGVIAAEELSEGADYDDCQLKNRVVKLGDVSAFVPPPGEGVSAAAESAGGEDTHSLTVFTSPDGVVTAQDEEASGTAQIAEHTKLAAAALPKACSLNQANFSGTMLDPSKRTFST